MYSSLSKAQCSRGQDLALLRARKKEDGSQSTSSLRGAQRLEIKIAMEEEYQNNRKKTKEHSNKINQYLGAPEFYCTRALHELEPPLYIHLVKCRLYSRIDGLLFFQNK